MDLQSVKPQEYIYGSPCDSNGPYLFFNIGTLPRTKKVLHSPESRHCSKDEKKIQAVLSRLFFKKLNNKGDSFPVMGIIQVKLLSFERKKVIINKDILSNYMNIATFSK